MEIELFSTYKRGALQSRKTRTFLRKMARYIEHAHEIGQRDAADGKPPVPLEDLGDPNDSPMMRDLCNRAHDAYCAGYADGRKEV